MQIMRPKPSLTLCECVSHLLLFKGFYLTVVFSFLCSFPCVGTCSQMTLSTYITRTNAEEVTLRFKVANTLL